MVDFKLEVLVLPVADVDRAKEFYVSLGWRRSRRQRLGASGDHHPPARAVVHRGSSPSSPTW